MDASEAIPAGRMRRLLEVSRLLAITADLDLLLRRIAEASCDLLGCERASIFLHDPKADQLWTKVALQSTQIRVPAGAGIVGHVFKSNRPLHVARPYDDPRFNPQPDRRSGFITRNLLTAPMLDVDGKPVGVIQAVNKSTGDFDGSDEVMIQLLADQAGVAIQRYNLQQAAVEAMALRREMDLARAVQQALIPQTVPRIEGIAAAGFTKAASITGGDCYDLWKTPDGRLGIFLGDATGHGIGPAMIVSQTRTLIRAMCDARIDASPREVLACANARLSQDLEAGQFVTAFVAFVSRQRADWCSAGHGPIIFRSRADEPFQVVAPPSPPLGIVPDFNPDVLEPIQLATGGILCAVSDGIFEAFSPEAEEFGINRITQILAAAADPALAIAQIQSAVQSWQGSDEPRDDQTIVIAARTG